MIKRIIPKELNNKTVYNAIGKLCPGVPDSVIHKAFRKRDVKYNGVRATKDTPVYESGEITIFGVVEMTEKKQNDIIVYDDENIIIVDKPQGLPVHAGRDYTKEATLIQQLEEQYNSTLYLCHRLDRNTGGLLIVAKNKMVLSEILNRMTKGQIVKEYTALVLGEINRGEYVKTAWLEKDSKMNMVFIKSEKTENSFKIVTSFKVMETFDMKGIKVTKIKVVPITGRTHQIRAHMAFLGYPVLGDGKYGNNKINKSLKFTEQQLFSTSLLFDYEKDDSKTGYMGGMRFYSKTGKET